MGDSDELLQAKLLRYALEVTAIQEEIIRDLMNALHALEHVARVSRPELFAEYQKTLDRIRTESPGSPKARDVEAKVELARGLVKRFSQK